MFWGGIERDQWHELGSCRALELLKFSLSIYRLKNITLKFTRTFPWIATGLSKIPCIPKIADWGGLIIGVPIKDPNTPPFDIVNVPPSISSIANVPERAYKEQIQILEIILFSQFEAL